MLHLYFFGYSSKNSIYLTGMKLLLVHFFTFFLTPDFKLSYLPLPTPITLF